MHALIVAHADAIVALVSAFFIAAASVNAIDDLRRHPFGEDNSKFTRGRLAAFIVWVVALLAMIGVYIYASGYASSRMNALAGFTSLYCVGTFTIRDGLRKKTAQGYAYAGVYALILVVAACLTALAPLPH